MRRLLLIALAGLLVACTSKNSSIRVATGCEGPGGSCAQYVQGVDNDGAPLDRSTLIVPFTSAIRAGDKPASLSAVTATLNLETRTPDLKLIPVTALRVDGQNPQQLVIELGGILADGAAIDLPDGAVKAGNGKNFGPVTVKVKTNLSPLAVALSDIVWEPSERLIFTNDNLQTAKGATDEPAVRQELAGLLRMRPAITEEQLNAVLARFDDPDVKRKAPDHRVRAGLLLLTGTSGEPAIEFVTTEVNRRGVPFQPIEVQDLKRFGAAGAVFYQPLSGRLRMIIDAEVARDSLENVATVIAHEALHSSLGGGSGTEETLAMASNTRVYEELLVHDPSVALSPTLITRHNNRLVLALRNSGRFGYPMGGILPRPGIDDAMRGTWYEPARSFRDLLFASDFYGDIPKTGDIGSEVIEAYYQRIAGTTAKTGRLKFDQTTLKLYDQALDHGLTDAQILAVTDALKLKPVPLSTSPR